MLLELTVPDFVLDSVVPRGNLQPAAVRGYNRSQVKIRQGKEGRNVVLDPEAARYATKCRSTRLEH